MSEGYQPGRTPRKKRWGLQGKTTKGTTRGCQLLARCCRSLWQGFPDSGVVLRVDGRGPRGGRPLGQAVAYGCWLHGGDGCCGGLRKEASWWDGGRRAAGHEGPSSRASPIEGPQAEVGERHVCGVWVDWVVVWWQGWGGTASRPARACWRGQRLGGGGPPAHQVMTCQLVASPGQACASSMMLTAVAGLPGKRCRVAGGGEGAAGRQATMGRAPGLRPRGAAGRGW